MTTLKTLDIHDHDTPQGAMLNAADLMRQAAKEIERMARDVKFAASGKPTWTNAEQAIRTANALVREILCQKCIEA